MTSRARVVYARACPNCGSHVDDARLLKGLVCKRCLAQEPERELRPEELLEALGRAGKLSLLRSAYEVEKELKEFEKLFTAALGSSPWSAQRTWARRVLLGKSFSIIAPTGVGKTVFGLAMSLFLAARGFKSYLVMPTTPLVEQAVRKLEEMKERAGVSASALAVHGRLGRAKKREALERFLKRDFDVLVTTSKFMLKHCSELSKVGFRFVFVDDVDAVLKSGKSVAALLRTLGFTDEDVSEAKEAVYLKRRLVSLGRRLDRLEEAERLSEELEKVARKLESKRKELGVSLVVSSATSRPRGTMTLLFRELLGFQAGSRSEALRRVVDLYYTLRSGESVDDAVAAIVEKLGSGGLVYVPVEAGAERCEELAELLRRRGVKAEAFHAKNPRALDKFVRGDVDVLVGVATYYGVLVRGLDLPWRVRYAVFAGVPRFKFSLLFEEPHPLAAYRLLSLLAQASPQDVKQKAKAHLVALRRVLLKLSPAALQVLAQRLKEGLPPESSAERVAYAAVEFVREALKRPEVVEYLKLSPEVVVREEEGRLYILIPDTMTYVQASGRTSRLYVGGLTLGISVVIVDDKKLFDGLIARLKWFAEDVSWRDFVELERSGDLSKILEEVDRDRERVLKAVRGELKAEAPDLVKTVLLVVESPTKARTIASFFGRPSVRILGERVRAYEVSMGSLQLIVAYSGGHVCDLAIAEDEDFEELYPHDEHFFGVGVSRANGRRSFVPLYTTIKKCRACGYQTVEEVQKCPRCGSSAILDSAEVVEALRELAAEVDEVLIGTDPDTEGEKIAWDLAALLRPFAKKVYRVEFHEVTRKAILEALKSRRSLNKPMVEAQLVRRIEDRWIGFTLSPILWRDFWRDYCDKYIKSGEVCGKENRNLSAGRVQTPVLGWVIERYEEHGRSAKTIYRLSLKSKDSASTLQVVLTEDELGRSLRKKELLQSEVFVREVALLDEELNPPPPYTTDSMLSDATRELKLSAQEVMRLAQDLFELGLITYHRTDSARVSDAGIAVARDYLAQKNPGVFSPRRWGEGGAHEAIRPTKPIDGDQLSALLASGELELPRPLTKNHIRLYDLIFRRFIASQSKKAVVRKQVIELELPTGRVARREYYVEAVEPGYLGFYRNVAVRGQYARPGAYVVESAEKRKVKLVPLYTQGEVVELMKRRRIGRPSTYATILGKLLARGYVIESKKSKKLVPTRLGREVYRYLTEHFKDMVSEERTRLLEEKMDLVAEEKEEYEKVLEDLYEEVKGVLDKVPNLYELEAKSPAEE